MDVGVLGVLGGCRACVVRRTRDDVVFCLCVKVGLLHALWVPST